MQNECLECGAVIQSEMTCQSAFDEFLALEFTDAEYGAVHFLTVACFMVQHGRYSDAGLAWIEPRLRDYLEKGIPIEQIRQDTSQTADQSKRAWKVTRRPADPPQPKTAWSMSILDVASQYYDAASYRALITKWARSTLREMQPLVRG